MAIDESAGVLARRDRVLASSAQSYAVAVLARKGPCNPYVSIRTLRGLQRRGLLEICLGSTPGREWQSKWRLTDAGTKVAETSPAVKEWLEGWAAATKATS